MTGRSYAMHRWQQSSILNRQTSDDYVNSHIIAIFQFRVSKTVRNKNSKCWIYQQQHNYGWQAGPMQCINGNRVPFEQINMGWLCK